MNQQQREQEQAAQAAEFSRHEFRQACREALLADENVNRAKVALARAQGAADEAWRYVEGRGDAMKAANEGHAPVTFLSLGFPPVKKDGTVQDWINNFLRNRG